MPQSTPDSTGLEGPYYKVVIDGEITDNQLRVICERHLRVYEFHRGLRGDGTAFDYLDFTFARKADARTLTAQLVRWGIPSTYTERYVHKYVPAEEGAPV